MNYTSTRTIESKTQGGARFVLKRMNERRRQALAELQAEPLAKLKPLYEELGPLNNEYVAALDRARAVNAGERKAAIAEGATEAEALQRFPKGKIDFAADKFRRWLELKAEISKIQNGEMRPIAMRFVVVRIEDYEIDDTPADLERQLAEGPDEFTNEIADAVKHELALGREEAENLPLPSTSPAAVDGVSPTGSAGPAETTATTTGVAAESSTGLESAAAASTGTTP